MDAYCNIGSACSPVFAVKASVLLNTVAPEILGTSMEGFMGLYRC